MPRRLLIRELPRLGALVALVMLLWFTIYERWPGSLGVPLVYVGGDEAWVHAAVKAVRDGEIGLFGSKTVRQLGAPFGANWNDFPYTEDFVFYVTGQLARLFGVFTAVNLAYAAAITLASCSFYLVGRYMRWAWPWCFAGAVLYGWSYYITHRSVPHFNLLFYWPCPFWLLICWWTAGRRGIPLGSKRFWFSAIVVLFTAWNNAYYTNVFVQLLALALLARVANRFPLKTLVGPLCLAGLSVMLTASMLLDTFAHQLQHGSNGRVMVRYLSELELYSLRPIDLFLPYFHRLTTLEWITRDYAHRTVLRGEIGCTYLGVIGCLALLLMFGAAVYRLLKAAGPRPNGLSLQALWLILCAICGGLNMVPGLLGFPLFRAMNRVSIVLLALALFYAVRVASRETRRWPARVQALVAFLVIAVGVWDQAPVTLPEDLEVHGGRIGSDRAFVESLEKELPADAMVFQLPVMRSQESGPIHRMQPYEQFVPYLFSTTLRFSHGDDYGRATDEWRRMVAEMPPAEMVKQLERHGFHGVLINRKAYGDDARGLLEGLAGSGKNAHPKLQHGVFAFVPLDARPKRRKPSLPPHCAAGWFDRETRGTDVWYWSEGAARIELHRPRNASQTTVTFDLQSSGRRTVQIKKNGKFAQELVFDPSKDRQRVEFTTDWTQERDVVYLDLETPTPHAYPPNDRRRVAFCVINPKQTPSPFAD